MTKRQIMRLCLVGIVLIALIVVTIIGQKSFRSKFSNSPTPTLQPGDTTKKGLYKNDQYGFEFNYPSNLNLVEQSDTSNGFISHFIILSNFEYNDKYIFDLPDKNSILIRFIIDEPTLNVNRELLEIKNSNAETAKNNSRLGNVPALKGPFELTDGGPGTGNPEALSIQARKGDVFYYAEVRPYTSEATKAFDNILSTFKFVK